MSKYYKIDLETKIITPCDMFGWARQLEEMSRLHIKHVADEIVNDKRISTVWLGLNHAYSENELPKIFETMVFDPANSGNDIYCKRYTYWEDAQLGHERAKQWVIDGCKEGE